VTIGNPSTWLVKFQDIHDKVLHVISDVWPDCARRFHSHTLENQITDQLALMLQRDPRSRGDWRVEPQHKLLDSDQAGDVVTKGFIDFVVIFDLNQENYIAYECKRLNVLFPSGFQTLADKYVDEGVMRYVSAQYAQELPFGVMIGYVFDSNAPNAFTAVKSQIQNKASRLQCMSKSPVNNLPPVSFIIRFTTGHSRPSGKIEVQHLLLPLST
jgi:hypothetical protein